ncbi:hypothetical protein C8F01DRAFT_1104497 [Mycena amicta]|nr:hypothetical protein C8F01DRAFT_1104497 [Mycena amicta]
MPPSTPPSIVELPATPAAPSQHRFVLATPMSPLTPLPETPRPVHKPTDPGFPRTIGWGTDTQEVQRIDSLPTEDQPTEDQPTPTNTQIRATAEPSRPITRDPPQSRLPRPSLMGPPPTKAPPPPVPGSSRTTTTVAPQNAFSIMMGSQNRGEPPKTKGKAKEKTTAKPAVASSSKAPAKVPAPKDKGKAKVKTEQKVNNAKKPNLKGKMRAREKPKPTPIPILVRLPEDDDEPQTPTVLAAPAKADSVRSMSPLTDLENDTLAPIAANDEAPLSPLTEPTEDNNGPAPIATFDEPPLSPLTEPTNDDTPADDAVLADTPTPLPPPSSSPAEEAELDLRTPACEDAAAGEDENYRYRDAFGRDTSPTPATEEPAVEDNAQVIMADTPAPSTPIKESVIEEPVPDPPSKGRPKSRVGKPRAPPPLPAPADRVTRSTSLKRKEAEDGPTQRTLFSFGVGPAKLNGNPAKKQKVDDAPSKIPIPSPSKISSFANPTKASSARAAATKSPTKKPASAAVGPSSSSMSPSKNRLERSSSVFNPRPPRMFPFRFSRTFTEGSSSLQSLASALERLRAPPPERPNTSMGFSQDDVDTTLTDFDQLPSRLSPVALRPSSSVAGSSNAAAPPALVQRPLSSFLNGKPAGGSAKLTVGNGAILRGGVFGSGRGRTAPKVKPQPGAEFLRPPEDGDATMLEEEEVPDQATEDAMERVTSPRNVTFDLSDIPGFDPSKKGKKRELPEEWRKNASRRASMALNDLSKSVSLPVRTMGPPEMPADRPGMRTSSSSYPSTSSSEPSGSTGVEGMRRSTRIAKTAVADTSADEEPAPVTSTPAQLTVLKGCVVFVDVISEQGDDSLRSLYADTLKTLGARVLGSVGQTCTHIVYKNGLRSTYTKYKALAEPRPHLVGMEWVVKCAEAHTRQDETPYLIDLDDMNTTAPKRRKTMMPLFGSHASFDDSIEDDPSVDVSSTSISIDDDLTPLERARQRKAAAALAT